MAPTGSRPLCLSLSGYGRYSPPRPQPLNCWARGGSWALFKSKSPIASRIRRSLIASRIRRSDVFSPSICVPDPSK